MRLLADILAVLAMTMAPEGSRESLRFKLAGSRDDVGDWGHEFARSLAGEVAAEHEVLSEAGGAVDHLMFLVRALVPYFMLHNAEHEAVDLLMDVGELGLVEQMVEESTYERVCLCLSAIANYVPEPEDAEARRVAFAIYLRFNRAAMSLRLALRLGDRDLVESVYRSCADPVLKKQLALILGRQNVFLDEDDAVLAELMHNMRLSSFFKTLAKELDIVEPKHPDSIFESKFDKKKQPTSISEKPSNRLAATYVSAMVNAGSGHDHLVTVESKSWAFQLKEHGMMAATASIGLLHLWNVDEGLSELSRYLDASI
ncbi:MAG TPA: hypothetical protein VJB16_00985, partial [archaeon]|nr:hypothetical protein [archaeon]